MEMKLFFAPGACSRVTMSALEEIGVPFEAIPVNIHRGDQKKAAYKAINPKGKVPALAIGGRVLTENAAILHYLHSRFPEAALLPPVSSLEDAQAVLADLLWCSSTLHPLVRQIRNPARLTDGDTEALHDKGVAMFTELMTETNDRLSRTGPWWSGQDWSIMDVYLFWCYDVAASGGYDLAAHQTLVGHRGAVRARESFQRARAREMAAAEQLGLAFPPGFSL